IHRVACPSFAVRFGAERRPETVFERNVGGARLGEKRRSVGVVGPRSRGESLAGAVLGIAVADEHRDGEFVESVADLAALANASSISWSERRESTVELVARRRKRSS